MTGKQRVRAALEGRPVDRLPVAVLYSDLYRLDHFSELTGRPQWHMHQWQHASPEEHVRTYRQMVEAAPLEVLRPLGAPSREAREGVEFIESDGKVFRRQRGELHEVPPPTTPGHATDYHANETQHVFDNKAINAQLPIRKAEEMLATGCNDYLDATVATLGNDHFILSGGVVGTIWACGGYVGQTNLLAMLIEKPDFVESLCGRILEQNIEHIRMLAAAGGDAIYIDDATATSDMVSVAHYERFSLPYVREMVREIHALGHKAIVIYFGGVMDRLDQIASIGADALSVEASMKSYVNDIATIAEQIGDRVSLFGNIDPFGILERASDAELAAEVARQAAAGRKARGFIISTGSPITPATPLARVRRFIELGRTA
jgi:uroporphyrinogen-III decarboxylase